MKANETYLTTEGLRGLEEELDQLRSVRRLEIAERIHGAKQAGELENAEYEEAKTEQGFIEGRVAELEEPVVARAQVDLTRTRLERRSLRQASRESAAEAGDITTFVAELVEEARESLARTPDLLPVLRIAGVVAKRVALGDLGRSIRAPPVGWPRHLVRSGSRRGSRTA